jgi:hypothetical protein
VQSVRLSGKFVAYGWEFGREEVDTEVRVIDLMSGRRFRGPAHKSYAAPSRTAREPGITDLELTRRGDVAWIFRNVWADPPRWEVSKLVDGEPVLLDAGEIGRHSLAASGGLLYWTRDGLPHSAPWP